MKFSVEEQKAEFVGRELTALLRRIDKEIDHAVYEKFNNGEEYVEVHYRQYLFRPESSPRPFVVCVTADSLSALTRDVLKAIE